VISKAINQRLDKVIDKLTSMNQKAYNGNRYIQESIINTVDAICHCENDRVRGAILSIDQTKAFDSVYTGYMKQVYKFFGFGESFIKVLGTIGTGRTSRVILDGGKTSKNIDLDRGFMQGDGPSPRLYNIGEQILLFRLEYDPQVKGVYINFLVPRSIEVRADPHPEQGDGRDLDLPLVDRPQDQREVFHDFDLAVQAGLTVEQDLKYTKRKVSAFADDTDSALDRSAKNLGYVKTILEEFGIMSGLETNVEKTSLMPIGCLDEILSDDLINLGFKIVTEIKCLGVRINNKASNLEAHFDGTIRLV
jgi:hypothetical protein